MNGMQGTYRGEQRVSIRATWLAEQIPHFVKNEVGCLARFLEAKRNMIAVDVGANKGFWSKALLRRFPGAISQIYMIDASPENYSELINTADSLLFDDGDFSKLIGMHFALGSAVGEVEFYTNDEGSPLGSLFPHTVRGEHTLEGMGLLTQSFFVPCQTLDNIASIRGLEHIDVLKIDAEGSEFDILRGAEKTITAGKIDVVLFEFGVHQVHSRHFFRDFYKFFCKFGYTMWKSEGEQLIEIKKYNYVFENFTFCCNYVASRM